MYDDISREIFSLTDDLGPVMVVHLSSTKSALKAIVVVDNTAAGPAMGGVRMTPGVTTEEVARLARAMTLKNAMAYLPHGGGKSGIIADPASIDREKIIRSFARGIRYLSDYIPGPDMGTGEREMAFIKDEIGRAVGLPREMGGLPLDEMGSTGYGVAVCAEVAAGHIGLDLQGAKLAVEGFGAVGKNAARFLAGKGTVLIAASDSKGTIYNPEGLDVETLIRVKQETGSIINYEKGDNLLTTDLFNISTDIFVPAAKSDVITRSNADILDTKLIVQGANLPVTHEAEKLLHERGVLNIPDIVANAGGVITASVEYHGGTEKQAIDRIEEIISRNTRNVISMVEKQNMYPRDTAELIARHRVLQAMKYRE